MKEEIKIGDEVLVHVPMFSSEPIKEKVKDIDGEWLIFEGDSGKIQIDYCTKIK